MAFAAAFIVVACIAFYYLSTKRYAIRLNDALVLVGSCGAIATAASLIVFISKPEFDASDDDVLAIAPETVRTITNVAPLIRQNFTLQQVGRFTPKPGAAQGGIDRVVFGPSNGGTFDARAGRVTARAASSINLSGWAADVANRTIYKGIIALLDGSPAAIATYDEDRLDVARYLHLPEVRYCGFHVALLTIHPGKHVLTLAAILADAKSYQLIPMKLLVIVVN